MTPPVRCSRFAVAGLLVLALAAPAFGGEPRPVKVSLEYRDEGTITRDDRGGSGSIIVRRGDVRARGGLGAASTTTRTRRSSGVFTIVRDGGTAMMAMTRSVPFEEIRFYEDWATGHGFIASGIAFEEIGTSIRVGVRILDRDRILVQLTPSISWFAADRSVAIEATDASTELVVRHGEPVTIAGGSREVDEITRRILGIGRFAERSESSLVLTAEISR